MKEDYISSSILTASINIKPCLLQGDINKLILDGIKRKYEGVCNKDGFILRDSIELLERSIGQIKTINNESLINYNITYKADIISPCEGDKYDCYVETINKLGIIAYLKLNDSDTMKESPFIIIVPKEYVDEENFEKIKLNDKIKVLVKSYRIKYKTEHIQIIGNLV